MRVPEALRELGWELPHNFLGLDEEASAFDRAKAVILPVPYEATTSYGGGTASGPSAILEASRYIELYDQELDAEPYEVGVATLPALELTGAGPAEAIAELRAAYDRLLDGARGSSSSRSAASTRSRVRRSWRGRTAWPRRDGA